MSQFSAYILSRYSASESDGIMCPIFSQESVADFRLEPPRISLHSDVLVLHSVLQPLFRDHGRLHSDGQLRPRYCYRFSVSIRTLKLLLNALSLTDCFTSLRRRLKKAGISPALSAVELDVYFWHNIILEIELVISRQNALV